ncbi:restriction modification system DNA specificity domain protein [Crinalium epipsammum PCC 9333]|uniref:Restriction modification system DNA specificity domain protein n=1 Tax=Crinalium epipsammum PCC 9333 TaxID=1173022 RepID=K9VXY7_9CYAN|nr:restriction endonuclease subunit S [Crinalium epipsammum]AFZ12010.1 restriction modification system DNA specificity domain protein [Crinalium epipsammum PCC 9333]
MDLNKHTNATTLLEKHFDIAFAAPDGIKKLRELILSLAMQGKLVPQDPSDQPASELLKEIEAEKERLIKEGKIKKSQPLPEIKPDEIPYDLPNSWEWVRIEQLVSKIGSGSTPRGGKDAYEIEGIPFLRSQNIWNNEIRLDDVAFISEETHRKMIATKVISMDILLNITGASLGRCAIVPDDFAEANVSQHVTIIRCVNPEIRRFIHCLLLSPYGQSMIWSRQVGMSREGLSKKVLEQFQIPLPPLAEQRRLIAKIDELMARCDELERLRSDRDRKQITVHNSALNRLIIAKDQSDFNTAWQFITQHFSELYSVKENVTELRKAILQLAVMGKLVPQDPNDQPASELLKEIEKEKERLVKEGKIKKSQPLPKIKLDEVPYNLPTSWEWTNLQDLFAVVTDGDHQAPPKVDDGIPFLVIGNLNTGKVTWENCRFVPHDYYESIDWGRKPSKNDILYTVTGSYGIPIFIDSNRKFCVQRHVAILKSVESSPTEYITHLLKSKYAFNYATSVATGIAQKTVPLSGLRRMPIAVPPMNEQHRIVAKIDQLMALCDNIEKQIDTANSKQTNLLNAVMTKV